jgi:hypothetical protein
MLLRTPRWFEIRLIVVVIAGVVSACGGDTPLQPSPAAPAAVATTPTLLPQPPMAVAAAAALSPADLTARGWTCFQPPVVPVRTICSHPNQGLPVVGSPPPEDRPATYNLFRFDGGGTFLGSVHLIRTDLYSGQPCQPSGSPYAFVPIIGYYECLHPVGRE